MATLYANCEMEGGNPKWWSEVQGTPGEGWYSSNTYAIGPDGKTALCAITGTAEQIEAIAALKSVSVVLDKKDSDKTLSAARLSEVKTAVSKMSVEKSELSALKDDVTGIMAVKALYRDLGGINFEQEGAPDPGEKVVEPVIEEPVIEELSRIP